MFTTLLAIISFCPLIIANQEFWLQTEIVDVQFIKNCIKPYSCKNSYYQLSLNNLKTSHTENTNINRDFEIELPFKLTKFIDTSNVEDYNLSTAIFGQGPYIKSDLKCDSTEPINIFQVLGKEDSATIYGKGKCFSVTIEVTKIYAGCPWCEDSNSVSINHFYILVGSFVIAIVLLSIISIRLFLMKTNRKLESLVVEKEKCPLPPSIYTIPELSSYDNSSLSSGYSDCSGISFGKTTKTLVLWKEIQEQQINKFQSSNGADSAFNDSNSSCYTSLFGGIRGKSNSAISFHASKHNLNQQQYQC